MQAPTQENQKISDIMRTLAISSSASDFNDFLKTSVKNLALLYGCKFAFVGELRPCGTKIRTLAVWAGDTFAQNFEYDLEGTPCQDVLNHKKELIPRDAAKLYPEDQLLIDMQVDSYFGAPLLRKNHSVMGIVSVMNTVPLQPDEWSEPVLSAYSVRLAVELESKRTENELESYRNNLESLVKERTEALEHAHRELIRQERLATLGQLIATVSHELRNPLGTIRSSIYSITEKLKDKNLGVDSALERIQRNINRSDKIISELLDFTRIKKVTLSSADFNKWLESSIEELSIPDNITLQQNLDQTAYIEFDKDLMHRAILNVWSNACQAIDSTGTIIIQTTLGDNSLTLSIIDTGKGMDKNIIDHMFEPLYSTKGFGVGMGLFIVNKIIEQHNGLIDISSNPGKGTAFNIKLPLSHRTIDT